MPTTNNIARILFRLLAEKGLYSGTSFSFSSSSVIMYSLPVLFIKMMCPAGTLLRKISWQGSWRSLAHRSDKQPLG